MIRTAYKHLLSWKNNSYLKPLLVRGARQVGKTTLIENFANKEFADGLIKIDFEARPDIKEVFSGNLEPSYLIPQIELFAERNIVDGQSIIFFDEIQECPRALMALRYFFEQRPNLHVIAAGSLLEFALTEVSFPVGRIKTISIYPMSFFEFLLGTNKLQLAELIKAVPQSLPIAEHKLLLKEFINYLYVGGMPEAVKRYIATKSIFNAMEIQSDLVKLFESDFNKYAGKASIDCLRQVFRATALHLTKPVKFSHLTSDFSVPTIKNALELLTRAQVVNKIPAINPSGLPLGGSASNKRFKIILADIGLLHGLSQFNPKNQLTPETLLDAYRGSLAEQVVGQGLIEQSDSNVYTWYRDEKGSQAEVDFVISNEHQILPIEVKSGSVGRMKSILQFLSTYPLATKGVVFSTEPFKEFPDKKLTFLPIYYAGTFLEKNN